MTKAASRSLSYSLRSMRSRYHHVLAGAPVAQRATSSDAGQWAGVAFASAYPCRALPAPWPDDLFASSRIQLGAFFSPAGWISGAVVYGFPEGRLHPNALARTEAILDFAFRRLVSQPGPKFMAGDWNFTPDVLPIVTRLQAAGWIEVQDLAHHRFGHKVLPTCKGVSRKDHLWLSPELARTFCGLTVDPSVFADHSVLVAAFSCQSADLERFPWPCPVAVPWSEVSALDTSVSFGAPHCPTAQYATLWKAKEALAQQSLGDVWLPSMAGRGQQTRPGKSSGHVAPLSKGRTHDVQPLLYGFSALHAKRFKQLRRLQNFVRWASSSRCGPTACLHGIDLWNSILRAPGFGSGFSAWWPSRHYVCPGDPPVIPQFCPSAVVAARIYDALFAEVRLLEQRLVHAKASHRRTSLDGDRNLVFRAVGRTPAAPVETLLHRMEAKVTIVDQSECALELDRSVDLCPDQPLWVAGQSLQIIHAEADKVWVDDVSAVPEEAQCVQTQLVGDLRTLFDAFHEQWRRRWCRHDGIPFSHWTVLLDFAKSVLRPVPCAHLRIDGPMIRAEASRKKRRAATGLDGVSRQDLVQADAQTLASLASMHTRAEADGQWPQQVIAGKVHSLAKTEGAAGVGDFRPITIFGLPYRVWSSIQSRYLLQFAERWVDDGVFGNRRGRQASDLWSSLLLEIEQAYASGVALSGVSADLEKCFNCIPRYPALCLAVLVGVPHELTTAWSGALASMCRHFKVRDSYSAGFLTSTGLAEGCGLSVFGMLLIDHLFALWMRAHAPSIRCLTYVDDWQTLTSCADAAIRQLGLIEQFAGHLDLTVDGRKTFCWATCPDLRAALRQSGANVLHHARELGGHMGISRQFTNKTLRQRLEDLSDFWDKLRSCNTRYEHKVYMLQAVAWPRGLHAVASAQLGDQVWLSARRQAVKALGLQRPGVNPLVLLSLVEACLDPQFVACLWTFRFLKAQCPLDFWAVNVAPLAMGDWTLPPNAPASVALARAQVLGLSVSRSGLVSDRFGPFCLQTCNSSEIFLRLQWAWQNVVAQQLSHRTDFDDLWRVDTAATRRALRSLGPDDRAMYRFGLSGGLFTERYKSKWADQSDACPWCGAPDTLKHRYWECPQHHDLRVALAPDVAPLVDTLPPVLALRGWAVQPPTWLSWINCLWICHLWISALLSNCLLRAVTFSPMGPVFSKLSLPSVVLPGQ